MSEKIVVAVLQAIEEGIAQIRTRVEEIVKSYGEMPIEVKAEFELDPETRSSRRLRYGF